MKIIKGLLEEKSSSPLSYDLGASLA